MDGENLLLIPGGVKISGKPVLVAKRLKRGYNLTLRGEKNSDKITPRIIMEVDFSLSMR
jgi:hypothetical protein